MKRFEGKNCLVTGAASGIGRATADRLAEEGANVALLDINADGVEAAAAQVAEKFGVKTVSRACDVADFDATMKAVTGAIEELGGLQVLCHIAGKLGTFNTHEMTFEDWRKITSINLDGTFNVNRACLPALLENRHSAIVNMASTAAIGKHPWMSAYAAAKGGVISFTRSLYMEYVKQGLRANCVVAGGIATPLHMDFKAPEGADMKLMQGSVPLVNFVGPEKAASVVAFLASDDARYINGTEVRADGGALS